MKVSKRFGHKDAHSQKILNQKEKNYQKCQMYQKITDEFLMLLLAIQCLTVARAALPLLATTLEIIWMGLNVEILGNCCFFVSSLGMIPVFFYFQLL